MRYGADRLERVTERTDGVEANVAVNRWLVKDADAARLGIAIRRVGLVYESIQYANAALWVSAAGERSVQLVYCDVTYMYI